MKKRLSAGFILIMMMFTLTACHREHTWVEATCTSPAYCSECGETMGMPLGHEWAAATCTKPETCVKCGQTRGETAPHNLTDANFQEASVCIDCGFSDGEPLEAGFDKNFLTINAEPDGTSHDYVTRCNGNSALETVGKVRFGDYHIYDSDDEREALEGYEWRSLLINAEFMDDNAWSYGPTWAINPEDFYDIERFSDEATRDEDGWYHFTVNWYGEDYPDCLYYIQKVGGSWSEEVYTVGFRIYVRVPVGYDGIVITMRDTANVRTPGMYVYGVSDENTIFCRLITVDTPSEE